MSLRDRRLQRVRKVRHVQEQVSLSDWTTAEALATRAAHDKQQADAERQRALEGLRVAQSAQRNIPREIVFLQRCLDLLGMRRAKLAELEAAARKRADEALGRWRESKRALTSLERLEVRAQASAHADRERKEIRELDAVAGDRSAANRRILDLGEGFISRPDESPDAARHLRLDEPHHS